jgi:hypothetical protein
MCSPLQLLGESAIDQKRNLDRTVGSEARKNSFSPPFPHNSTIVPRTPQLVHKKPCDMLLRPSGSFGTLHEG